MPWETPSLRTVRSLVRDAIAASLPGADATPPNSVLRVVSDSQGALCHLTLQYIDWLALQLLPDTAEQEWLDRHGQIWLVNADGSTGRKLATLASGSVIVNATQPGTTVPQYTPLTYAGTLAFETLADFIVGTDPAEIAIRALDPGIAGNLAPGTQLSLAVPGIDPIATVVNLDGGTDDETDDELRFRVLKRIREPPQGGSKSDYEQWALAVSGCTRAWCDPNAMGMGTVTVRVMFDDLRASNGGFPYQQDLDAVTAYIDSVRPVAVKDFWVLAPIPQRCDVNIINLDPDNGVTRAAVETSLVAMFRLMAKPGQTIFAAWKSYAIMNALNVISFDLRNNTDDVMQSPGHMGVLGNITYGHQ